MKKLVSYGLRLISAAIIIFLCYGWWVSDQAARYQTELGPQIRERFGFATGTPMVRAGNKSLEVLTLYPEPGGVMETAGVRQGDIVLSSSLTGLYRQLDKMDGEVRIIVAEGGDGLPIEERPSREISLQYDRLRSPKQ